MESRRVTQGNLVREQWARLMEHQGWSVYGNAFDRNHPEEEVVRYEIIDGKGYQKPDLWVMHRYPYSPVPPDPTAQAHLIAERYDEVTYKQTASWTRDGGWYDFGFERSLTRDYQMIQRHTGIRVLWIVRELHEPVDPHAKDGFYGLGEYADEPAEGTWFWIAVEDVPRLGRESDRYPTWFVRRDALGTIETLPTPKGLPRMAEVLEADQEVVQVG